MKAAQKKRIAISKLADTAKKAVWPSFVFNLSNELAFKFNLCVFGDKAMDIESRTSYATLKQVIYIETDTCRYEISRSTTPKDIDASSEGLYTFSKVLDP